MLSYAIIFVKQFTGTAVLDSGRLEVYLIQKAFWPVHMVCELDTKPAGVTISVFASVKPLWNNLRCQNMAFTWDFFVIDFWIFII